MGNKNEDRPTLEQAMKLATAAAKKGSVKGHHILGILELEVMADIDETLELERAEKQEKVLKHLEHAAAIGGYVPSFGLLRKLQHFLNSNTFDELEAKHKEALALEWSEERESYMANKTKAS